MTEVSEVRSMGIAISMSSGLLSLQMGWGDPQMKQVGILILHKTRRTKLFIVLKSITIERVNMNKSLLPTLSGYHQIQFENEKT